MADDIKKIHEREAKWQQKWQQAGVFTPKNDGTKQPFYMLAEFPFPSGTGLHGGHMLNYTGCDVMARFRRMQGFDVLYPLGFDSLGISAENYATKIGKHPSVVVRELAEKFTKNMLDMGWSIDLNAQVATSDPEFIKWTQWMFIQFFKAGLAYKSMLPMNWCPNCRTTLTNEELEDGKCNRCHGEVEVREKMQWNLAITKYADKLLDGLNIVDYPEKVKRDQINWIGRSTGADVDFRVGDDIMTVYTTRVDTIFGVTFCAIAPEHKLLAKWLDEGKITNADAVRAYIKESAAKSEFDRTDATKDKTGVKLEGIMAVNPFTGTEIPVFVADYVLVNYAHGTIMAVPAHDSRDWDFAKKFGINVIPVLAGGNPDEVWEGDGEHINSDFLNGMGKADAIAAAIKVGEERGFARPKVRYRMGDWGFSRQMYWGEPIPLIYCEKCGWVPVPESELPLMQPHMEDFRPTEDGESPLARATDWVKVPCPCCGAAARRETDTMPQWAGSSWYFLRYLDPRNNDAFCSREQMEKWMPVGHYNGGNEHNTRHLIYSRFWHRALFDLGHVNTPEPYHKRTTNGLLMGSDGKKMSKSAGNGFQVDEKVAEVGADAARVTVLSLGPWDSNVNWSEGALAGVQRFLKRVEGLADNLADVPMTAEQERLMHKLIADATERLENMKFNTTISAMMEYINAFPGGNMPRPAYEALLQVLNPFAPHLTEEMWEKIGHSDMLVFEPWPKFDATKLVETSMTIVASVNGKRVADFVVSADADSDAIVAAAREVAAGKLAGTEIVKTIIVPKKLVNFVVKK